MTSDCIVEVQSSSREPLPLGGELRLSEDLHEGSRLRFEIDAESAPSLSPGDRLELRLQRTGADGGRVETEFVLWVWEAETVDDGAGRRCLVEARDPLAFCGLEPAFLTHAGGMSLLRLAQTIVERQALALERLPAFGDGAGELSEWLLQCEESGAEFVARQGFATGQAIYWNRLNYAAGLIGHGPAVELEPHELLFGHDLQQVREIAAADLVPPRVAWTDPVSRRSVRAAPDSAGTNGTGELAARLVSVVRPNDGACLGRLGWRGCGGLVVLDTTRPDLALGLPVRAGGRTADMLVARVDHRMGAAGSYRNSVTCVPRSRWGAGGGRSSRRGGIGLLQAEVTHNDDPQAQQRVRVILQDDPERRPSPWIPLITPSAGADRGLYWIPERGDLVLVMSDGECPESMTCLGSLRGQEQKASAEWRSDANAWKVVAGRGGVRILLNDQEGSIRIETEKACFEMTRDGGLRLIGDRLRCEMATEATHDAPRINLGLP